MNIEQGISNKEWNEIGIRGSLFDILYSKITRYYYGS